MSSSSSSRTLEISLFQSNAPGCYGSWTEEQAEATFDRCRRSKEGGPCCSTEFNYEKDQCQHHQLQQQQQQQRQQQYQYKEERPGPHTGPKGVLADYKAHQQVTNALRAHEQAHRQAVLLRIARGSNSGTITSITSPHLLPIYERNDNDSNDDDDLFLRNYRAQRLNDLKLQQQQQQQQDSLLHRPRFGGVEEVSGSRMVEMIETLRNSSPCTKTIVHIYESHLPACRLVNSFLPHLAAKHPFVSFLRLHQGFNLPRHDLKLDEEALPLLLVYDGGDVKECVARVDNYLGAAFLCEDLEGLLEEKGVWG
ncbi:hypothetical protein VYU27_003255 [Nannochloropsis oceanica]